MKIGVLALQGAFAEHIAVLKKLKVDAIPVRLPHQLEGLDGLIIPGGESTTITKLMVHYKLQEQNHRTGKKQLPHFRNMRRDDCPRQRTIQQRRRQTYRSDGTSRLTAMLSAGRWTASSRRYQYRYSGKSR